MALKELVKKDTTSKITQVFLRDSTTGQGKTGVAAASMAGQYSKGNAASVALSFATGAVGDAYSSGKWAEIGNGRYYYHAPDAMFSAFGDVVGTVQTTGAIDGKLEFQIVAFDPVDTVRLGMTALPNAAADAAGGLVISDAGGLDIDAILIDTATTLPGLIATAQTDLDTITGTDGVTLATAQALYAPAKAGNQMDLVNAPNATAVTAIQNGLATPTNITAGTITTVSGNVTGTVGSVLGGINTTGGTITTLDALDTVQDTQHAATQAAISALNDIAATDIVSAGAITTSAGAVSSVTTVATCTTNADMRGTDSAYTGTPPTAAAVADAVWEEAIADHSGTSGSTAESLNAAGGAGDPWVTTLPGSYTGTQAGKILADVLADTGELQTNQGNWLTATGFSTHDAAAVADAVWDEVITGAQHNVSASAARFLRESATATTGVTGTLQSATGTTAVLESGAVPADDYFNGERLSIIEGTGSGQSRLISDSTALTDTVTLGHAWTTTPDATSIYAIMGAEADVRAIAEQPVAATGSVDFDDMATILAIADKLDTGLEADGASGWQWTTLAVANVSATVSGNVTVGSLTQAALAQFAADDTGQVTAAAGSVSLLSQGGAGTTEITVVPLAGTVQSRVSGTTIEVFTEETTTVSVAAVDATGAAVDVSAMTLELTIENEYGVDVAVIANASITKVSSTFSFAVPAAVSTNEGQYRWAVRQTGDDGVLMQGPFVVTYAPGAD